MTALGAFTHDFTTLFITRVGVGVGEACLIPAGGALIADSFPRHRLARANSIFIVGGAFGAGISLLLGGAIVQWISSGAYAAFPGLGGFHGWQAALLLAAAPGLILALLIGLMARDPRTRSAGTPSAGLRTGSPGTIGAFFRQHRTTLLTLWLAYPLASAAAQGWLAWIPAHLSRSFGLDPGQAALCFGCLILSFGAGGTLLGGYLTDVLFRRGKSDAALQISIVSFILLALIGSLTP
ncbi:MAG TPA: MFS transporter, partial [Steroidobacteraceae bacterium]|nr:MFS transporter [Steroidobacteraceae bacterium]